MKTGIRLSAWFCITAFFAATSYAQPYPAKVVRMVVAFGAGSGNDTVGRIIAAGLAQAWGQQVIVDNRPGAAGNIGAEYAAKAPPDGYTLFLMSMAFAGSPHMYKNLAYDINRDFVPITLVVTSPSILVVHRSLPVRTVAELIKLAKSRPGAINYSSGGVGTPTWVAGEVFKSRAGIDLLHVPYRSGADAITAVLSGEVSVYFAPLAVALPHIRTGRLHPLAVTSAGRLPLLPEYQTVAELGFPGYQAGNWYGLMAPARTAKEITTAIRNAALAAMNNPATGKRLADLGYVTVGDQPEEFAAFIKTETATLGKLLKAMNITPE